MSRKKSRKTPDAPRGPTVTHKTALHKVPPGGVAGVWAFTFLIYLLTLYPSVPGGDSGGLITAAHQLGVPHPPGYPLWTLLGKLFTLIPIGSIAWRINLFSAVCGSSAAALLALTVSRWTGAWLPALGAAGLFAFAPLTWHYAVRAEVFALNNLFVAILLFLLTRFNEEKTLPRGLQVTFVSTLGLSHHHTFLFFSFPAFLFVVLGIRSQLRRPWNALRILGAGAAGFLPYAYLPLASAAEPIARWGATHTFSGFVDHFLRRDYGTFRLWGRADLEGVFWMQLFAYFRSLFEQTLYVGPLFAYFGLRRHWKDPLRGPLLRLSLGMTAGFLLVFLSLSHSNPELPLELEILSRFWQQANFVVFFWAGLGISPVLQWLRGSGARAAIISLLVTAQLVLHYRGEDMHSNRAISDYGKALLTPLPPNTLLLSLGDLNTYSMLYLHECENLRSDVRLMDRMLLGYAWTEPLIRKRYPDVSLPPGKLYGKSGYSTLQLIEANIDRFPVFVAELKEYDRAEEVKAKYRLWKVGFLFKVLRKEETPEIDALFELNERIFASMDPRPRPSDHFWESVVKRDYWQSRYLSAFEFVTWAFQNGNEPRALRYAIRIWEDILERNPKAEAFTYKNLGIAYKALIPVQPGAREAAIRNFRKFLELTPQSSPDHAPAVSDLSSLER